MITADDFKLSLSKRVFRVMNYLKLFKALKANWLMPHSPFLFSHMNSLTDELQLLSMCFNKNKHMLFCFLSALLIMVYAMVINLHTQVSHLFTIKAGPTLFFFHFFLNIIRYLFCLQHAATLKVIT